MIILLGGILYLSTDQPQTVSGEGGLLERAETPTVPEPPEVVGDPGAGQDAGRAAAERAAEEQAAAQQAAAQQAAAEQAAAEEEEVGPPIPSDTTMSLSIPALGLSGIPVVNDSTEAGLTVGAGHVPGTGFPWEEGANTYIAGHRLGYPGTLSDHVFYNLPNLSEGSEVILTDANGTVYTYQVTEIIEVTPNDAWVLNPVPGRDIVSLQTCIEDFGDYWTDGPNWFARYVVRADRVA